MIRKNRGQATVEYALLLLIIVFASVAVFQVTEGIEWKVSYMINDLRDDLGPEVPEVDIEDVPSPEHKLSPPIANFIVPSPNYKGREIHLASKSFDTDGVIEHYIWNINGKEERRTKFDIERDEGIVVKFRYKGTYTVSLTVIDNDGLVSNVETKTVEVIDRSPFLSMTVSNTNGQSGKSVNVCVGQNATFYTEYGDPDLPYDVLKLDSYFMDFSGVRSNYDTVPHSFSRTFYNEGTNTYHVTVTDEDGVSVSDSVTVKVIPNTDPSCNVPPPTATKPVYKIVVTGHTKTEGGKYCFEPGTTSTIKAEVTWGTNPAHSTPLYWRTSDWQNTSNSWGTWDNWNTIHRPYPYPAKVWKTGDPDMTIFGMARDVSATSTEPNPNLNGMSNSASVVLSTCGIVGETPPTAIISLNNVDSTRSDKEQTTVVNVAKGTTYPNAKENTFTATVNSKFSNPSGSANIAGVRWILPNGTELPKDNLSNHPNAVELADKSGQKFWYFPSEIDSPDTQGGKDFIFGQGPEGPFKNIWTYKLEVIDDNGLRSNWVTKKIELTKTDKPPNINCKPTTDPVATIKPNESLGNKLAAYGWDPEGSPVTVQWSKDNGTTWTAWQSPDAFAPSNWSWSTTGKKEILLKGTDGNHSHDVTKKCYIDVKSSSPIKVEWWSLENRVAPFDTNLEVTDASTPSADIAISKWQYITQNQGNRSQDKWSSAKWATGKKVELQTYRTEATFTVWHYVTTSDPANIQCQSGNSNKVQLSGVNYCMKSTEYWRLGWHVWTYNDIVEGWTTCRIRTVNDNLKTYQNYVDLWDNIRYETSNGVRLKDIVIDALQEKCHPADFSGS